MALRFRAKSYALLYPAKVKTFLKKQKVFTLANADYGIILVVREGEDAEKAVLRRAGRRR